MVLYAEPIDGPAARELSSIARDAGAHLLAGVATRAVERGQERYYNSALLFAPDGSLVGEYRKQRLFAYAREHHAYSSGDGPLIATIGVVRSQYGTIWTQDPGAGSYPWGDSA